MNRTIFSKIEENNKTYRIQTELGKWIFSFLIMEEAGDEIIVYKSPMILEQNIKSQAEKLAINMTDYVTKLISFFEDPSKIKFTFTKKSFTILEAVNANFNARFFHSDLNKVTDVAVNIGNVIDELQSQKHKLEKKQCNLEEKNEILKNEVVEYKNKLNELVERKKVDERTMLQNFVLLLNEKKKKIQQLNELLDAFRTDPSLANPTEVKISSNRKRKRDNSERAAELTPKVKEEVSESDENISNDEYNTSDSENFDQLNNEEAPVEKDFIDDILDESPPKIVVPLKKLSKECNSKKGIPLASTSKCIEAEPNEHCSVEKIKSEEQSSFNAQMVDINTQDWLDRL